MRKTAVAVALGAALAVGSMGGATAAPRDTASISFFKGSGSDAHWAMDDGNQVIELSVAVGGYAGVALGHVAGKAVADVAAPSFDFLADTAGASGGSPRLVVRLSDGGRFEVRPLAWSGGWDSVDGADAGTVDTNGGACGYRYGQSWAAAQACATAGATVTGVFMVSDSWWVTNSAYTTLVDNLQYDGKTFGSAADNRR